MAETLLKAVEDQTIEEAMPYVNIQITEGATREQKAALVRDVTNSLVRELGKKPEHIHIVIQEVAEDNWGFEGLLTDEWKQQQSSSSRSTPS